MSSKSKKIISIVVPVFNEEENIFSCYELIKKELDRVDTVYDYEFVFTDNRSTDQTFSKLKEIAAKDKNVRVARFSKNFGYQKSIYTGYCLASGDCAIAIDCDLQDPPELIHEFIRKWEEGYEVVYGVRRSRQEGWLITSIRRLFYRAIDFLSEDHLPLNAGDFRLIDRKILNELKQLYDANPYLRGTIASLGFNQIGIPYDRKERIRGKSKYNLWRMFSLAIDGILNHSIVPLRCATYFGFFVSLGLIIYFVALFLLSFFSHDIWPRGFATVTVLIISSIGLNALFLGVIGEYILRIYQQIKMHPMVVIDRTLNLSEVNQDIAKDKKMSRIVNSFSD